MSPRKLFLACLVVSLLSAACGRHRPAARAPSKVPAPTVGRTVQPGDTEVGYASWYGDPYHGRRAANGEIYDKNQMTAAHLTLPFETVVKATNLENSRSVVVRITDRGPFVKGRIIDLSMAAARQIAMIGPGTAMVRLEVLSAGKDSRASLFVVQVGAFQERTNAERLRQQLQSRFGNSFIQEYPSGKGLLYRVRVGPQPSLQQAYKLAAQLGKERLEAFVIRMDP
ncbi:MAG: septal ring lytic transglycosylase RlpA family protein [Acidobacteria bacterium]|nr:septal ring lytic transglycosylase RlpA family protein [Acidobacteriota bacterium]